MLLDHHRTSRTRRRPTCPQREVRGPNGRRRFPNNPSICRASTVCPSCTSAALCACISARPDHRHRSHGDACNGAPYLIDHQQQHGPVAIHANARTTAFAGVACTVAVGMEAAGFHRHVPAIFTRNSFTEFRNTRTSGPRVDEGGLNRSDPPQQRGGDSQHMHNTDANPQVLSGWCGRSGVQCCVQPRSCSGRRSSTRCLRPQGCLGTAAAHGDADICARQCGRVVDAHRRPWRPESLLPEVLRSRRPCPPASGRL